MNEEIERLEKELDFSEMKEELKHEFEKHLRNSIDYFKEEFWNWNHLQEEFTDNHNCETFLNEVIDEVLEEVVERGEIW